MRWLPITALLLTTFVTVVNACVVDSILVFKKYTIVSSNNRLLDERYKTLYLPKSCMEPAYRELRKLVEADVSSAGKTEFELLSSLNEWVSRQWEHDGARLPGADQTSLSVLHEARAGRRFNCDAYALVLSDVLISYGYIARRIYLRSRTAAYSGAGQGHVAVGVFSNQFRRWLFLDPQNNGMILRNGEPASAYDAIQSVIKGDSNNLEFRSTKLSPTEYKDFFRQYDGFVSIALTIGGELVFVSLPVDTTIQPYMTFQGIAENGTIFTNNRNSIYMPVNNVNIAFYSESAAQFDTIIKRHNVRSTDEYVQYQPLFSPGPIYFVKFRNNVPWFARYEFSIDDGPWMSVAKDVAWIRFHDGLNILRTRAINEAGVPTPEVRMEIKYD